MSVTLGCIKDIYEARQYAEEAMVAATKKGCSQGAQAYKMLYDKFEELISNYDTLETESLRKALLEADNVCRMQLGKPDRKMPTCNTPSDVPAVNAADTLPDEATTVSESTYIQENFANKQVMQQPVAQELQKASMSPWLIAGGLVAVYFLFFKR